MKSSNSGSVFQKIKIEDLKTLLQIAKPFLAQTYSETKLLESAQDWKKYHLESEKLSSNSVLTLEQHWYDSIAKNKPDYAVYSHPDYLGDIWTCWCLYSRHSVLSLNKPNSLFNRPVTEELKKFTSICDLGCGFGYTTLGLKEILPSLSVSATNIENSYQYEMARQNFAGTDIKLHGSVSEAGQTDIVFASEYFEHFERPIEHLSDVLQHMNPSVLILANTFKGTAIGHFNVYKNESELVPNHEMSKKFNQFLKKCGYTKIKTKIWNQKPSIWVKNTHKEIFE